MKPQDLYTLAYAFGEGRKFKPPRLDVLHSRVSMLIAYTPQAVPFTYSAEVFPLEIRSLGMAFGTATTWIFCWALSEFLFGANLPTSQTVLTAFRPVTSLVSGEVGQYRHVWALHRILRSRLLLDLLPRSREQTVRHLQLPTRTTVPSNPAPPIPDTRSRNWIVSLAWASPDMPRSKPRRPCSALASTTATSPRWSCWLGRPGKTGLRPL